MSFSSIFSSSIKIRSPWLSLRSLRFFLSFFLVDKNANRNEVINIRCYKAWELRFSPQAFTRLERMPSPLSSQANWKLSNSIPQRRIALHFELRTHSLHLCYKNVFLLVQVEYTYFSRWSLTKNIILFSKYPSFRTVSVYCQKKDKIHWRVGTYIVCYQFLLLL